MLFITVILAVTFVPGITHDSRSTHLEAGQFNLTATRHRQSGHKDNSNLQPASLRSVIKDTLSSNNINSNNIASNPVNSSDYNANGSTQQWSNYTSVLPPGISYSNYTTVLPPGLSHSNYASVLTSGASYTNNFQVPPEVARQHRQRTWNYQRSGHKDERSGLKDGRSVKRVERSVDYDDSLYYYEYLKPPKYETIFQPGMNCNFETDDCVWELFPKPNQNKGKGSHGLTRVKGIDLNNMVDPRYKYDADENQLGHLLMFKAGYTNGLSAESNHSYIESPRIEKSLSECTLSFYVMSTVEFYKPNSNDHAYFEVMIVDDSNAAVPLQPNIQENRPYPWTKLEYAVGSYNKFRNIQILILLHFILVMFVLIEIVFFKGINETRKSIFGIDNIKLSNCLKLAEDKPQECNLDKEYKCKGTGLCVSRSGDLCDYRSDCALNDDEDIAICADMDRYNGGYRCDFSEDYCDWSLSGPMKWERIKADDGSHFLNIDVSQYMNENLVTLGILRSPLFTPPPEYNENDTNPATFQSCELRLFFKATKTAKIDFFEVEIIEKTPLTKVSRGSRVIKPVSNKMKSFAQTHADEWTKIEAVIPRGLKYGYYIQLNAVKGPDASGPSYYNMSMANISLSPQCFGLGVEHVDLGCWRHDLIRNPRDLAECMGVPYPEEPSGVFSYAFTTCAENVGPRGPYKESCSSYYEYQGGNSTTVDMLSDFGKSYGLNKTQLGGSMQYSPVGIQKWKVPYSGIFTVIAKGASGGHGRLVRKSSHGAVITVLLKLEKDEELYILVGQEGQSACVFQGVESKSGLCSLQGGEVVDDPSAWTVDATQPVRGDYYLGGHNNNNNYLVHPEYASGFYAPKNKNYDAASTGNRARRSSHVYPTNGNIYQDNGHIYGDSGQGNNEFSPHYEDIMRRYHKAEEEEARMTKEEKRRRRKERKRLERSKSKENKRRHGKGGDDQIQSDSPSGDFDDDIVEGIERFAPTNTSCDGDRECLSWKNEIKNYHPSYQIGGGGGGGATFIFKIGSDNKLKPLLIAGGGGGMADISGTNDPDAKLLYNNIMDNLSQVLPEFVERPIYPNRSMEASQGGYGGGWNTTFSPDRMSYYIDMGLHSASGGSEIEAWLGGYPCNYRRATNFTEGNVNIARFGGFGGGGGGCNGGGGGGGFIGGLGGTNGSENGYGGVSYYDPETVIWLEQSLGKHTGPGEVFIIPDLGDTKNLSQCRCYDPDSLCMPLNEGVTAVTCYCKNGKIVDVNVPCVKEIPTFYMILLVIGCIVVAAISGLICMCLYTQYQRRRLMRSKLRGPDGQLSMLRNSNGIMMTEYNPNYEFGGGACSLMDLKEVERDKIRLVKALGQGAFGEVYQGHYRKSSTDSSETAVAVKTLTELSTNQAEMDFLMEALIMSKFNHSNIVQFIGVCFDKHPRYIILELLAGGDLKTFLRESRPKPDRPSSLTMRDLLSAAIDVCKGCSYLEENHFIHRDIAARNCLLTTKGPGRVVKIADFGMARDIYRADYYRKGGKAMLPVKWMPPEAFLDGIFTSKTDIWSFGILLWEVMSLGYMPYPGRGNQEVMQLVTNGGRLEPPNYCPGPLYGLMSQCWHPIPEERPNFHTIMERLGYCLQDPEVVMAPLPVFHRPLDTSSSIASSRRDLAEGNSSGNSGSGGSVSIGTAVTQQNSLSHTDYMIPNTSACPVPEQTLLSNSSAGGSSNLGGRCPPDSLTMPLLQKETSFTVPQTIGVHPPISHVMQGGSQIARNGRIHSARCSGKPPVGRRSSQGSSHHSPELVTESKSTEPLLPPSSPTLSDTLDMEGIPPPPRPYPGPPPPPIPPPPHPYKDHALPLNPAQLRMSACSPPPPILPPPPSSYANVGVRDRNGNSSKMGSSASSSGSSSMSSAARSIRPVTGAGGEVYTPTTGEISV